MQSTATLARTDSDPDMDEALRRVRVGKAQLAVETEAAYFERDLQIREAAAWETATDGNWVPFVAPTAPTHRRNWVPAAQAAGNDHYWDDVIDGYSSTRSAA